MFTFINLFAIISGLSISTVANGKIVAGTKEDIAKVAHDMGEDPLLLLAIAKVESSFNPKARGKIGEIGLFQIRPEYHPILPEMNVREQTHLAIRLLQALKVECGKKFLQCWNMGAARTTQKNFKKTKYETKVQNAYKDLLHSRSFSSVKDTVIAHEKAK